jgi:hypothetical protein
VTALNTLGLVSTDYEHVTKRITPGSAIAIGGTLLKWYDIAPATTPVPEGVAELARACMRDAVAAGALELDGDLGFVILHRCGASFYFLLIQTWRNENELWETVWAKDGESDPTFRPWPLAETHHPTFCVWELGAVCHEQQAWSRYLRSSRDLAAREEYLASSFAGEV